MAPATLALAALFAAAIGLTLGLIGGGGSILTVPVFAYVLGYPAKDAIAMALPEVGVTSLVGVVGHWRAGNVNARVAMAFGLVAMLGSFGGAQLARMLSGAVQLTLLGAVMIVAALSMLRVAPRGDEPHETVKPQSFILIGAVGLGVGMLTGLVGIGGGFIIVPALVLIVGVPIRNAIGTSLAVIAMNSLSGFLGYVGQAAFDWRAIGLFTIITVAGILVGTRIGAFVRAARLKQGFAIFLLVVATYILYQNRGVLIGAH